MNMTPSQPRFSLKYYLYSKSSDKLMSFLPRNKHLCSRRLDNIYLKPHTHGQCPRAARQRDPHRAARQSSAYLTLWRHALFIPV